MIYWIKNGFAELGFLSTTCTTPVTADRGTIYDCNMNILAAFPGRD